MTPAPAAELLGAYVCEICGNADSAVHALRYDYEVELNYSGTT